MWCVDQYEQQHSVSEVMGYYAPTKANRAPAPAAMEFPTERWIQSSICRLYRNAGNGLFRKCDVTIADFSTIPTHLVLTCQIGMHS